MTVIAALLLVAWIAQLVCAWRVTRGVPSLDALPVRTRDAWPRLTMIVPARDEGAQIEAALASKLACGYPALEVVAVDDRSRDATGAIIDRFAADDARVVAAHVTELPAAWLGKLNAMSTGLAHATGEWVLFSDADVHLTKGTLERIVAHAEAESIDFVAVFPKMHPVSAIVDGALATMLRVLAVSGRAWKANDDGSKVGVGVGAFSLARREWLDRTHAIAHLRMEVADDVALGALMKQQGARCRFYVGREDVHLVFLDSIGAMARSADKGGGMLGFSWVASLAFAGMPVVLDLVVPALSIAAGGLARLFAAATLASATLTHLLLTRHFRGPLRGALTWPIGLILMSALVLRSGLKAWRSQGVTWRDTFYPRAVIEAGRRMRMRTMQVDVSQPLP